MRGTPLRRVGLMLLAVVVTTLGMTTPAQAADTGTITGKITYNGSPVADVAVSVTNYDTGESLDATTDGAGRYTINGVPTGSYRVQVNAEGHPEQYAPNTPSWVSAPFYAVNAGGTTTADATLIPFGTITGRLTASTGTGASYVSVSVTSTTDWSIGGWDDTDWYGYYAVPVPVGEFTVQFVSAGASQYAYGERESRQAETFTVAAGQSVTVDDTLLPTGSASGTVLTAGGQPATGVTVDFAALSGGGYGSAVTDAAGGYRLDSLAPGQYRVSFTLPDGQAVMYHPRVLDMDRAQPVTVVAGQLVDVDQTLLPTGAVVGRLTEANGTTGVAGATVEAHYALDQSLATYTDANGYYRIEPVFAGSYRVNFRDYADHRFNQWATGRVSYETANVFAVAAGATRWVNDKLLATGSVKVTAKDATTGAAVPRFRAQVLSEYGYAVSGAVTLSNVAVGTHPVRVDADGYEASEGVVSVTVTAGQQAVVTVVLNRVATILGKVVDAAGAPVAGVCVDPIPVGRFALPEGCGNWSDAAGNYLRPLRNGAGSYHLFAIPDRDGPYGAQWVGATGGTGDPRQAAVITAADRQWVTAPTIKLDRAGTITGTVTSETGQPLDARARVGVYVPHPGLGAGYGHVRIGNDGRYSTDFLGPYQWALVFEAEGHATQWSGAANNRFSARTIKVNSDAVTTYNYTMQVGSLVQGTIKLDDGSGPDGRFLVSHSATGEFVAVGETVEGKYQLRMIMPAPVTFAFENHADGSGQNLTGTSRIYVQGYVTLNFCPAGGLRFEVCGTRLPAGPRAQETPSPSASPTAPPRRTVPMGDRPADRL
ncbi:carboxypeptidase regulatory-like domain-containing protein [Catellatospora sp. NPDC049609]|uniref:carboxypeptidase regulatory-like domain-containing protein n=1 Tax=Catellatospora sp. NPDC049609 TaxID=3155505 RepID=UPI00342F36CF